MLNVLESTELLMAKVVEFAEKVGLLDQLQGQLEYLGNYACNEERGKDYTRCDLYPDFAPMSFTFSMFAKDKDKKGEYKFWFNGGLIYQGPDVPADGSFPSCTVSFDSTKHGWFVHT